MKETSRGAVLGLLSALCLATANVAVGQVPDTMTVATVNAASGTQTGLLVPIHVRDVGATLLNVNNAAGSRIDSIVFRLNYGTGATATDPGTDNTCISTPGGIGVPQFDFTGSVLESITPVFVASQASAAAAGNGGSLTGRKALGLIYTAPADAIAFVLNQAAPGDLIASAKFNLNTCPGGVINIFMDTALGTLANTGPTISETVANGSLALTNGSITVPGGQVTPTNTPLVVPTATNTPLVQPTATNTPLVQPTATNTPLVQPTATNTPLVQPTATNTPLVQPTATNTVAAPTATNTAVPPTSTNTPTTGGGGGVTGIPTLDPRALVLLASLLAAVGLMLSKRLVK